jgi:hypothetical protein
MEMALPVVDAIGEARSNADVFGDLCSRLGLLKEGEATGELDLMLHVLDALPGAIADDLRAGARPVPPFGDAPIQFVDVFPSTPDRKADLFLTAPRREAPRDLHRFQPDPATERFRWRSSRPRAIGRSALTLGELPRSDVKLTMHPDDAGGRG